MLHLGRPLNSAAALTPTAMPGYGMAAGAPKAVPAAPGLWAGAQLGAFATPQREPAVAGAANRREATKRHQVEAYLAALGPDQLGRLTPGARAAARELTAPYRPGHAGLRAVRAADPG